MNRLITIKEFRTRAATICRRPGHKPHIYYTRDKGWVYRPGSLARDKMEEHKTYVLNRKAQAHVMKLRGYS